MHKSHESRILAHRGHWKNEFGQTLLRKNSIEALSRAANFGFGIETDIRDNLGKIVISHDPVEKFELTLKQVLEFRVNGPVALNVKSDGLAPLLRILLEDTKPAFNYFFFDMSTPEFQNYTKHELKVAWRLSEFDTFSGHTPRIVWLDSLNSDWYKSNSDWLDKHNDCEVIIVSPELHKRSHVESWNWIADKMNQHDNLSICTDMPLEFLKFWQGYI
jgi:glycerophosphoryl diester phosphodiesterase